MLTNDAKLRISARWRFSKHIYTHPWYENHTMTSMKAVKVNVYEILDVYVPFASVRTCYICHAELNLQAMLTMHWTIFIFLFHHFRCHSHFSHLFSLFMCFLNSTMLKLYEIVPTHVLQKIGSSIFGGNLNK